MCREQPENRFGKHCKLLIQLNVSVTYSAFEPGGREFESLWARHQINGVRTRKNLENWGARQCYVI
jgi:hypothetical protein